MSNLTHNIRQYIITTFLNGQTPASFSDDNDLIDSGIMDSLAIINTVSYLEKNYAIEFGDDDIVPKHFCSINALVSFVEHKQLN